MHVCQSRRHAAIAIASPQLRSTGEEREREGGGRRGSGGAMEEEESRKLRQSGDLNYRNGISLPASKANGASLHSFLSFFPAKIVQDCRRVRHLKPRSPLLMRSFVRRLAQISACMAYIYDSNP